MNTAWIWGVAAALSWALAGPLMHLTLPFPPLQAWALALLGAFFVVRGAAFVRGVCDAQPWRSPAAVLGLGAVVAWGGHLLSEPTLWHVGPTAWIAAFALAMPLCLAAWAWPRFAAGPPRAALAALAAAAYILGRTFL